MRFVSFPIPDRGVPASAPAAASRIAAILNALERGSNVAVDCRQGVGRSGLIAAAVLASAGIDPSRANRGCRFRPRPSRSGDAQPAFVAPAPAFRTCRNPTAKMTGHEACPSTLAISVGRPPVRASATDAGERSSPAARKAHVTKAGRRSTPRPRRGRASPR